MRLWFLALAFLVGLAPIAVRANPAPPPSVDFGWYHCDGGTNAVSAENPAGTANPTKLFHVDVQLYLFDTHWDVQPLGNCTHPAGGCPDCTFPSGNISQWQGDDSHFSVTCYQTSITGFWVHRTGQSPPFVAASDYQWFTDGKAFLGQFARGPYKYDLATHENTGRWSTAGTPDRCSFHQLGAFPVPSTLGF